MLEMILKGSPRYCGWQAVSSGPCHCLPGAEGKPLPEEGTSGLHVVSVTLNTSTGIVTARSGGPARYREQSGDVCYRNYLI